MLSTANFLKFFNSLFFLLQVIDLGSGKGYLSSFLSLMYGLKVYGLDSSNTNTRGAKERNRKLKKHWKHYHTQSRADVNGLAFKMAKDRKVQNGVLYEADTEKVCNNSPANQDEIPASDFSPDFSGSVISNIRKQVENLQTEPQGEENLCFENAFSLVDFLPINAIEHTSSQIAYRETCETNKGRRKMKSKSSDCSVYSPLTSLITADSELHDIIHDLEVILLLYHLIPFTKMLESGLCLAWESPEYKPPYCPVPQRVL
jgi:hypothetical protein